MNFFVTVKLFIAIWLIHNVDHTDTVIMKFTNYVCENMDESIVQIHQCRLKAIKRNVVTLYFNATIVKPIHQIRLEAAVLKKDNIYKPWGYKISIDGCRFLRKSYNPFITLLYSQLVKYSNYNHTCPYEGSLLIQGFELKSDQLLIPFPTGDYLFDSKWFFNGKLAILAKYYFTFVENL